MKKQKIQLIVLVLVLAALTGAFFGVRKYQEAQAQKPVEEEGIVLFDVYNEDVINMIYDYEGETYHYEKVDGTWYLAEDHSQSIRQYYLNSMAAGASSIKATQVLENVEDLSQYGLETPQNTIIFDTAIQRFRIHVGDKNSLTLSYYIQLPDKPSTVYIVPQTYITRFNYGPDSIIEAQEAGDSEPEAGADAGTDTGTGAGADVGTGADAGTAGGTGAE